MKDLAKEGVVAGYLLGKSLGGGGGEVTEINTKLAGTWTSPPITGANVGDVYNINLTEIFEGATGFNADMKQTIQAIACIGYIAESGDYDFGDINWIALQYQIVWGTYSVNFSMPHSIGENLSTDKYQHSDFIGLPYSPNGNTLSTNMSVRIKQILITHPERGGYFSLVFKFNYQEVVVR